MVQFIAVESKWGAFRVFRVVGKIAFDTDSVGERTTEEEALAFIAELEAKEAQK